MRKKTLLLYTGIVAVCYLYTGSAYMSQFYRLIQFFDSTTVDIITSGWNYLLQAAGIGLFCLGLKRCPGLFGRKDFISVLLAAGAVFMAVAQLAQSGAVVAAAGYVFNFLIGVYSGCYLILFARHIPIRCAALCYGASYAVGSVGTYLLSLIGGGRFLVSGWAAVLYAALALMTAGLILSAEDIVLPPAPDKTDKNLAVPPYQIPVILIMMVISVVGSGLYYSLPYAQDVNWNLIRAFYAMGLVLAGFIMDRSRLIGEICAVASLTYPLIAAALIGEGVTGTAALSLSYAFRGFLSVYYVIMFTDPAHEDGGLLPFAPLGLMLSRVIEAILTLTLLFLPVSNTFQLIFSAICFAPLLILFVLMLNKKHAAPPASDEKRLAMFAEKHRLTARESEILRLLSDGMSDDEIAEKCYISRSTVRFHVSNILKKTQTASRVDAVRALNKFL